MKVMMRILWLFFISSHIFLLCIAEDKLVAVTVLIRHGCRIPQHSYPNDPYANISWPYVRGDLTDRGIAEMYHVGKWLRKKYTPFLSVKYDPNEIYAQSVDFDRCIMSGEATLAGLYPPNGDEIWNAKVLWQPIPLHISPNNQDIVVHMNTCPVFIKETDIIRQSRKYKKIMARFGQLFEYISEKTGESVDFATIYPLFDTLFAEKHLNLTLPRWAQKIWPQFFSLVIESTKMDSLTQTERRLQVGPILNRILSQFDRAISGEDFGTTKTIYRKYMSYFNTEWLLYDFTYALGLPDIDIAEFGALYLIELRKDPEGQYYVTMLYRSSTRKGTRAVRVGIKGEQTKLRYEKFKKIATPYLINSTEWVKLCEAISKQNVSVATSVPMS